MSRLKHLTALVGPHGRLSSKIISHVNGLLFHTCSGVRFESAAASVASASNADARPPPSPKIERIADEVAGLSQLELNDLNTILFTKLRLDTFASGMMPVMPGMVGGDAAPAAQVAEAPKEAEKTAFNIKLEKYEAAAKIKIIKEVRAFTDLGLKEAKELVEKAPTILKQGLTKEEATQIIEKIKAAGGTAVME